MLQGFLPPKGDKRWFGLAIIAAIITSAVVAGGTRLIIGAPAEGANGLLQAFLVGIVIFGAYWIMAGAAGYFGLKAMPLIMAVGSIMAVIAMLWSLKSLGNEGWGGVAAVGALVQLSGLAIIASVITELGLYLWKLADSRKASKD